MPFCTQCGTQVGPADQFCAGCGARQTPAPHTASRTGVPGSDPLRGIPRHTAAILCYVPVVGWIAAIIVLASPRFSNDRDLRFHAFQGIYLFVGWLLIDWVIEPLLTFPGHAGRPGRFVVHVLELAVFGAWVWMLVKTSQHQRYSLPLIGELAERSVAEQR